MIHAPRHGVQYLCYQNPSDYSQLVQRAQRPPKAGWSDLTHVHGRQA